MKHIVIAGAGFAGVRLARKLKKQKDVIVTLINDSPDFRYSPALYRAATGFKMGTARLPLEWMILDSENTALKVGKVVGLNTEKKYIKLKGGETVDYDIAVFGLGAVTTFFGIKGLSERAFGIKTPEEVEELKRHMHNCLVNTDAKLQNFVIIGAGPTGVELSGALGSYVQKVSKSHKIKNRIVTIYLIEAGPRILPQMSERAARKTRKRLEDLGVEILTDTMVKAETQKHIKTSKGDIHTHNVIWTAGTTNNPFFAEYPDVFKPGSRGKIKVNKHLQVSNSIYVVGDNADTKHSGLALSAIWHANFVARDIRAQLKGKKRPEYKPKLPTQVVPVGRAWAILQHGPIMTGGRFASAIRRVADIVGYTDILGPLKAMTIWSSSEQADEGCDICRK